jgi:integrase
MSAENSTADPLQSKPGAAADNRPDNRARPAKPYAEFPLTAHPTGRWCKKIRGRIHYFGPWNDPDAALAKYLEQKDALHAGRTPRPDPNALTIKDLCNQFLNGKQALVDAGELTPLTWGDYKTACVEIVAAFGKGRLVADVGPDDFASLRNKMARKWGPHRLSKTIQFIRCVFKHAYDAGLIDRPMRFGPGFKRPSKKTLRLHRAKQGPKLFAAEEVRALLDAASAQLKAMILLGINAGFGNADCGTLPLAALDLDGGWVSFPRPKTGIDRRCPLWPETIDAIRAALAVRPDAKKPEHAGLVFVTRCGDSWHTGTVDGPLSREFGKLLRRLKINGRAGLGFYSLRHTFRTVADESKDSVACDFIMGHEIPHMSTVYRERIDDNRLRAVAEHVRRWLFGGEGQAAKPDVIPFAKQA